MTTAGSGSSSVCSAAIDFAGDDGLAVGDGQRAGEGRLAAAEEGGEHLAGLVGIVVDRLLAEEDEIGRLVLRDGGKGLGDAKRFGAAVVDDEDGAIGAHGERLAQRVLGLGGADRDDDDLGRGAGFLEADGFFDGDLVKRVHRHLDVVELDAGAVGFDADAEIGVDDALDGNQNLHAFTLEPVRVVERREVDLGLHPLIGDDQLVAAAPPGFRGGGHSPARWACQSCSHSRRR